MDGPADRVRAGWTLGKPFASEQKLTSHLHHKPTESKALWWLILAVGAGLLLIKPAAMLYAFIDIRRNVRAFPSRAHEAEPVVEAIYRYYCRTARWPNSLADLNEERAPPLSSDWQYRIAEESDGTGPRLLLDGPYKLRLIYFFPKNSEEPAIGWIGTWEGDRLTVPVDQRIPECPKPSKMRQSNANGP